MLLKENRKVPPHEEESPSASNSAPQKVVSRATGTSSTSGVPLEATPSVTRTAAQHTPTS
eukprot:2759867-Amphidinium_carterae.1